MNMRLFRPFYFAFSKILTFFFICSCSCTPKFWKEIEALVSCRSKNVKTIGIYKTYNF